MRKLAVTLGAALLLGAVAPEAHAVSVGTYDWTNPRQNNFGSLIPIPDALSVPSPDLDTPNINGSAAPGLTFSPFQFQNAERKDLIDALNTKNWDFAPPTLTEPPNVGTPQAKFTFFTVTNTGEAAVELGALRWRSDRGVNGPRLVQWRSDLGGPEFDVSPNFSISETSQSGAVNEALVPQFFYDFDDVALDPGETFEFRLYGFNSLLLGGTLRLWQLELLSANGDVPPDGGGGAVPEPASGLLALGALALVARSRRKRA